MRYTLVMEWFGPDGSVKEDMRCRMGAEEFAAFLRSANDAASVTLEEIAAASQAQQE
jgi:GGDEF domain-containing protein